MPSRDDGQHGFAGRDCNGARVNPLIGYGKKAGIEMKLVEDNWDGREI